MIPHVAVSPSSSLVKTIDVATLTPPTVNLGGFRFDSNGAIVTTTAPVAPTANLCGLKFDSAGSLVVVPQASEVAPRVTNGGLPLDANGALVVALTTIANWVNGIPVTSTGAVVASGA